ncbi:phospholipase D-like domain-containing protein [Piscinibacter koreensis]|uniref:Cardiolipin synthase n=1 Tax=Piscinibacter koreensis TaxID=2742824 RepID=A0A7Y6NJ75_9BURK|nr:phospholipase D-like domain-containing protein [Schlegelella koreensis]NUZ04162.1 cardiolipin synthase [Schlegelella koreensis]
MPFEDALLRQWLTLHGVVVAIALVFYVTVSRAFPQRRDPSAAVGWVIALALLPYLALPLFVMFGSRKLLLRDPPPPRGAAVAGADDGALPALWAQRLGRAMGLADATGYERLSVHADGAAALRALHEVIASAERTLDVSTFILAQDRVGEPVIDALKARARAGVRTRLLIDGIGALLGGRVDVAGLRAAGVEVVKFVPPFRSILRGRANLRNHRKLVIADSRRFWCGGRNLAAPYFELPSAGRPLARPADSGWHDLSFDCAGPLAADARRLFDLDWAYATRAPLGPRSPLLGAGAPAHARAAAPAIPAAATALASVSPMAAATALTAPPQSDLAPPPEGDRAAAPLAQLVPSGPDQVDDTVQVLLVSGAFIARRRIVAVTPYFVPDAGLQQALTLAARRGVEIDLVLPARSNHRLADLARNRPLRELHAAGARVWLTPHMVHAKAVVIDDEIALVGSANLDARSLFLNYELMVAFYESRDIGRFADWIERERAAARPYVAKAPGLLRDLAEGLVIWLAFQL